MNQFSGFKKVVLNNVSNVIMWGHLFMLLLVFLSMYFYAERVLYYDSAYQFFKLINSESYNIEASRWSAVIVQTLPLLAIKLGMPIKMVLIIGSFSYTLIAYIVFIINTHLLKNTAAGIAVLFLCTLCVRDSFFYCVTELPVGMLFTTTLYAWIFHSKNSGKHINPIAFIFIGALILLICFFFHPMTFFSIVFILGFYFIATKDYKNPCIFSLLFFTIMLYALKIFLTSSSSYEGNLFGQLKDTPSLMLNLLSLDSTHFFISRSASLYLMVNILSLFIIVFYATKKNWLLLSWFLSNIIGFLLVCFIAFNKGDSHIAMEKYFMPLSLFVAIPFLHDIFSIKKLHLIGIIVCLFIFSRGINGIYSARKFFSNHIEYIDNLIDLAHFHPTSKLLVFKEDINENYTTWACATETLLRSASNEEKTQATVYLIDKSEIDEIDMTDSNLFLCAPFDRNWNTNVLNKRYFRLTAEPYLLNEKQIPEKSAN